MKNINPEEIGPRGAALQKVKTAMKIKTRQNEDTILHLRKIKITVIIMTTAAIDHPKEMKTKLIQDQEEKVRYPKEILEKEVLKIAIVIVIEAEDTLMIAMIPNPSKDTGQDLVKKLSTR